MAKLQAKLDARDYVIILLAIATALVHFSLLFPDPVFILNGLGYIALVAALYLPLPPLIQQRAKIRWVLMAYTALTVLLWILLGARAAIAYIDKLIEIILLIVLWTKSQETA